MRAGVSGSLSHQARDGPPFCGDGGRAPKLGADAEFLQAWWRRTAAERAATECVAARPSAGGAIAHALLRWARPFRGAQLPAACSLACAAFEYELRRSGREFAWGAGTRELGLREGKVGMAVRSAGCVSGAKGVDSWGRERRGAATLVRCARACVCAAHLGPRLGEAAVEVVEGDHTVCQLVDLGVGRGLEELTREPLERVLAVPLVQHLHVPRACVCVCVCVCVRVRVRVCVRVCV